MTADELCAELGIQRSTLSNYIKKGLPRDDSTRPHDYDPDECRLWIKANIRPRGGDTTLAADLETDGDIDSAEAQDLYRRERALKTAAERELRELKLAEERGELVRSSEVDAEWRRAALLIRTQVMQVADKIAPYVDQETEDRVRRECRNALSTLAGETEIAETERKDG